MAETTPLDLKFISIQGELMNETVYEVILPSKAGEVTILPGHEPMVTLLQPGIVTVRRRAGDGEADLEYFAISGGVVEVADGELVVLTDEAESDREISEKEAREAYERAVKAASEVKGQIELEEAKRLVSHQAARLKLAGLRRRHRERS